MKWLDAIRNLLTTSDFEMRTVHSDAWSERSEVLEHRLVLGSLATDPTTSAAMNPVQTTSTGNAAFTLSQPTGATEGPTPSLSNGPLSTDFSLQLANLPSNSNPLTSQSSQTTDDPSNDLVSQTAGTLTPVSNDSNSSSQALTSTITLPDVVAPSSSLSNQSNSTGDPTSASAAALATESSPLPQSTSKVTANSTTGSTTNSASTANGLGTPNVPSITSPLSGTNSASPPVAIDSSMTSVNTKVLVNSSALAAAKSGPGTPVVPNWFANGTTTAVIHYDFRDSNGVTNQITSQEIQTAQQVMQDWSAASGGRIQFVQDTTSPSSEIVNIGVGNLSALGLTGNGSEVIGSSSHQLQTTNGSQTSVGTIWLDGQQLWSTSSGSTTSSGTVDFATVMAHEVGHILGLADDPTTQGIMNPDYSGAQDLSGITAAFQNPVFINSNSVDANGFFDENLSATQLTIADVTTLLNRASVASPSDNAIIVIVDRNGNILGVRQEQGAVNAITAAHPDTAANPTATESTLAFATDGAVSLARTAAFFANGAAPITSRTIEDLSQTTILQREVEANPNSSDPTVNGPGFVAPVGIGGNFPAGIENTPHVDLFNIEASNRDSTVSPKGTRYNIDPSQIPPNQELDTPFSYGTVASKAGLNAPNDTQNRGIATLPGGVPIFLNGTLVGGIGVFFPGPDGYATTEQGFVAGQGQTVTERMNTSQELEAEFIAFAALGGSSTAALDGISNSVIGTIGGYAPVTGIDIPFGNITLNGIQLPLFGSTPGSKGLTDLISQFSGQLGTGTNSGTSQIFENGTVVLSNTDMDTTMIGIEVSKEYLAVPPASTPIDSSTQLSQTDIKNIINAGIAAANQVRATLRLNSDGTTGATTRMTFAITDTHGNVLAIYRMEDGTVFSTDVAVAKARNAAYYDDPSQLQAQDQVAVTPGGPNVPAGTAFTARTFRFLAEPFFPSGVNGSTPPAFSILNDSAAGGFNPATGENVAGPGSATAFASVMGHDVFNPGTNFHDPNNPSNQNGIIFFPGSTPLYKNGVLVGALGVSGDGVSQDDVVTYLASQGYDANGVTIPTADEAIVNGVRLPYEKFDRNPFG